MDGWVNWTPPSELGGPVQWVTPPVSHSAMGHSCLFFFTIKPPPHNREWPLPPSEEGGGGGGTTLGGQIKLPVHRKSAKKIGEAPPPSSSNRIKHFPILNPKPSRMPIQAQLKALARQPMLGARAVGVVAWRQPFRTALGFLQESFGAMPPRT